MYEFIPLMYFLIPLMSIFNILTTYLDLFMKCLSRDAANQLQRRQDEMRRVRAEIERQQEQINASQGKVAQEKG